MVCGQGGFDGRDPGIDAGEVLGGGCDPQGPQVMCHRPPSVGAGGLVADGLQSPRHLADDVGQPLAVEFGPLEPPQGLGPAGAEPRDPGRLLEHDTPVAS